MIVAKVMAASSEKFELLEDDLENVLERIHAILELLEKKTNKTSATVASIESQSRLKRVNNEALEAKKILEEMEAEARMAPLRYR